jgi:Acetyltransferase (GNAT) domain
MADYKVEVADAASYSKFLSDNPPDNPYSLLPLLEAYRDAFSCDFQLLFVVRNGLPVASSGLFVGRKFFQPIIRLMPMRIYDGVHFRVLEDSKFQKQEHERLSVLRTLEEYLEKNFSFHQMAFSPCLQDIRSFQWSGASVVPQYTYVIDLKNSFEENYTKSLREVLRSVEQSGLRVGICSVEDLVTLQQVSYERHSRRPPVPADKLISLLRALFSAGLLDIKCVRNKEGSIISALAWLRMNANSFFFVTGTDAGAENGASHLLYHEILKSEKDAGKSSVDFCGANTPTINLFKSAFGPKLEVYFKIWRANNLTTSIAARFKRV